jgi:hypothetical protein
MLAIRLGWRISYNFNFFRTVCCNPTNSDFVVPAKAGIQCFFINWTPACAGVTKIVN